MSAPMIRVEGHKELKRAVRKQQDNLAKSGLRDAHRSIAKMVAAEAAEEAPRRSGRLAKSVKGTGSASDAKIKAGTPARTPYAEVIHFGWDRRNIAENEFMFRAVEKMTPKVIEAYEELADEVREALT